MRRATLGVLGCAALALFTGCAGPVPVSEPSLSGPQADACARMMSDLPEQVDGQTRRKTKPGRLSAAWGVPPIVLTCGVSPPVGAGPDAQCFEVNGVGWYAEHTAGSWVFTTLGRRVGVQVAVPTAYAPEANALVDLARPIDDHIPELRGCV